MLRGRLGRPAATREESAALAHTQPEGVLVPDPGERTHRPPSSDAGLDAGFPVHRLAGPIGVAVAEPAERLVVEVDRAGELI